MGTILVCLFAGAAVGIILACIVLSSRNIAKREARIILDKGKIDDMKRFEQISSVLAKSPGDLESSDLWHKLQELKDGGH